MINQQEKGGREMYYIGFMGAAGRDRQLPTDLLCLARETGREIARNICVLVTGACMGTPHEAARGALEKGGRVVAFSPAASLEQHIDPPISYPPPLPGMIMEYTGLGKARRNFESISKCDAVIFCAGRAGTIMEFAIAYHEGKVIGVLKGSGGVADRIPDLVEMINKDTGATVIMDEDPKILVKNIVDELKKRTPK